MLKPIDNAKVKTKIQHEKMRESLMCFLTMKESKNHKLRAQRSCDTIKKASGQRIPFQKREKKHSKSEKQAYKEHMGEEEQ